MQSFRLIKGQPEWIKPDINNNKNTELNYRPKTTVIKFKMRLELGECPVCLYDKNLKILNCNHKLCLNCLDEINLHNKLENICPLCQGDL